VTQKKPNGGLRLGEQPRQDTRRRLASIRGHVEGIQRMLDEDCTYCVDVLKQIKAVQGALDKVRDVVLKHHLHDHVVNAQERGDVDKIVQELMEILKYR
jgi:DNA-binding FrmR family transcriptional regulator